MNIFMIERNTTSGRRFKQQRTSKNQKYLNVLLINSFSSYSPFQFIFLVVFKNQKCLDCGATGDARLMPKYCHMEPIYIHPGNIVQYLPKGI